MSDGLSELQRSESDGPSTPSSSAGDAPTMPAGAPSAPSSSQPAPAKTGPGPEHHAEIGRYKLIEELGRGGFGVVWRAEQFEPIHRHVALKILKPGMDSAEIIARFESERQSLAMMAHPNIAAVLDAGTTPRGLPYFVMELVSGMPITLYCDVHRLSIRERIALFTAVCQAVQHAHQKGVLHRDLKPSNILVAEVDAKPVPKVIDFGIAKALSPGLREPADKKGFALTREGTVVGTPQYMSPEQAGSARDVDTRSDVYALGVILHELLTGKTPLDDAYVRGAHFDEVLRMIRESQVKRPSSQLMPTTEAVRQLASARHTDPRSLGAALRRDLDWIVLKALEKERDRRYETPTALADDLQRYLRQESVRAVAPTWSYHFSRFARRHRGALVSASVVALALVGATVVSLSQARRATAAEVNTRQALEETERQRKIAEANFARAREAVDTYLAKVTDHPRLGEGDFHELRKQLLETAVPFYERFVQEKSDDPNVRSAQASVYGKLALVYGPMGQSSKAIAAQRRSVEIIQDLTTQYPSSLAYRERLGLNLANLGAALGDEGQLAEAEKVTRRALDIQQYFESQISSTEDRRENLAGVYANLGGLLVRGGQLAEGETLQHRAIEIREKLVGEFANKPLYREKLAMSYYNLANYLHDSRRYPESEEAFRTTLDIGKTLASEFPHVPIHRERLASTSNNLGELLRLQGQLVAAESAFQDAQSIGQKLVDEFPAIPNYRLSLANTRHNLAILLYGRGSLHEAETLLRGVVDARSKLLAEFPGNPAYCEGLAKSSSLFGKVLKLRSPFAEAESSFRLAVDTLEKLVTDAQAMPRYRKVLASDCLTFGLFLRERGQGAEAERMYRRALELNEQLSVEFPDDPEYRSAVGANLNNIGMLLCDRGQWAEARPLYERAIVLQRAALSSEPHDPFFRQYLRNHHLGLSRSCLGVKDYAASRDNALELPKVYPKTWQSSFEAAVLVARSIPVIEMDTALDPEQRRALLDQNAGQTIALLRDAIAYGYKDVSKLASDETFAPLVSRPDFQALLTPPSAVP